MSLIGHVFNKILNKNIPVYIAESGDGYKRLTAVISEHVKKAAHAKIKVPFENGSLFKDDDLGKMEQLTITNMSHPSQGDPNDHYSVQGETGGGTKVKSGHVHEDVSQQTQAR